LQQKLSEAQIDAQAVGQSQQEKEKQLRE